MARNPSHPDLIAQLEAWINEGGEIAKVARVRKARLKDCPEDVAVLDAEVRNIANYFGRELTARKVSTQE